MNEENKINWHIKCSDDRNCIIYKDEKEKFPTITLYISNVLLENVDLSNVQLENIEAFKTLQVKGARSQMIRSNKISVTT